MVLGLTFAVGSLLYSQPVYAEGLGAGASGHQSTASAEGKGISFGTGGYSDGIQLDLPQGIAGHKPSISLNLAPGKADGALGQGWAIGGLSQITRHSGKLGGVPDSSSTVDDVYMLDGQILYLTDSGGGWYETEHWNGAKIEYRALSNSWVITKDGRVSTYGMAVSSDLPGTSFSLTFLPNTVRWVLTSVKDPSGNLISYSYSQPVHGTVGVPSGHYHSRTGEVLISSIMWADAEVQFHYEARPASESSVSYKGGRQEILRNRLDSVEVLLGGQRMGWYELEYLDESGGTQRRSRLSRIWQIDPTLSTHSPGSPPPLAPSATVILLRELEYHLSGSDTWTDFASTGSSYTAQIGRTTSSPTYDNQMLLSPMLNGDAFSDLLLVEYSCSSDIVSPGQLNAALLVTSCDPPKVTAWVNSGSTPATGFELFDGYEPVFDSADPIAVDYATRLREVVLADKETLGKGQWSLTDLDGDGRPEILDYRTRKIHRYSPHFCSTAGTTYNGCWDDSKFLPDLESVPGLWNKDYGWVGTSFSDIDGDGLVDIVQRPITLGPDPGDVDRIENFDYYYEESSQNRDESFWYRNLGDFGFSSDLPLEIPLEDVSDWSADFVVADAVWGGTYPFYDFPMRDYDEYLQSRGTLGDYNGDGLADVAYSFYLSYSQDSHQEVDYVNTASVYSEIYWGDGRGGFVASGLSAGQPNTREEPHPQNTGAVDEPITYRPHHAVMDINRSGHPELVNARHDDALGFSSWLSLQDGFELWDAATSGFGANLIGHVPLPGSDAILSDSVFGSGLTSIMGSQAPWGDASTVGDFDGNGFMDVLAVTPGYTMGSGSIPSLTSWDVTLQLSDRDESHGAIRRVTNSLGGETDLDWTSSARLGSNEDLHYTREVLATLTPPDQDPIDLRYFKGEHALGRFRGFGLVESTSNGATTEYGYATSPLLEGVQVSQAIYRSDGTLESAQFSLFGADSPSGSSFFWDNSPPYTNPIQRECRFDVGHGATQSNGTRTQTVAMEDLWSECMLLDSTATITFEEWLAGMGWYAEPDPSYPSAQVADSVWGRLDDDVVVVTPSGSLGPSYPGDPFGIPGSPMNGGHLFPDENGTPSSSTLPPGTALPTGPVLSGESFPEMPGSTELWERTRDYHYIQDADGDGVDDVLLDAVFDYGITLGPVSWLLSADDTVTNHEYQASRDPVNWGFQLTRTVTSRGATNFRDTRYTYPIYVAAFGKPVSAIECGNDTSCASGVQTQLTYGTGSISGELVRVDYNDGSYNTRTLETYGPCAGRLLSGVDQEGRQRTLTLDSKCRPQSESFEGVEQVRTFDGFNRVIQEYNNAQQLDGTYSSSASWMEFSPGSVRSYHQLDSGAYRLDYTAVDSLGRTRKGESCVVTSHSGQFCPVGGDTVTFKQTYGSDGREFASYGPYAEGTGEIPVTFTEWSANGLMVAMHQSEHASANSTFRTTELEHHPGSVFTVDPIGTVREARADPLNTEIYVDGIFRGETRRNAAGRQIQTTTPEGVQTSYLYDDLGRLSERRSGSSEQHFASGSTSASYGQHIVSFEYDAMGRVSRETGADGTSMFWEYDGLGRQVLESFDDGMTIVDLREWVHGAWNPSLPGVSLEETDLETGATTELIFDGVGRLQKSTDLSGSSQYSYGVGPNPVAGMDVDGRVLQFDYDSHGRLVQRRNTSWPLGVYQNFAYNARGQIVEEQDADGVSVYTDYTVSGLPYRRYSPNDSGGQTLLWETDYDALGQPVYVSSGGVQKSLEYDSRGRLKREVFGSGSEYTRSLKWTRDDQLETETWSPVHSGSGKTTFSYDGWGRLISEEHPDGTYDDFYYDIAGQLRFQEDAVGAVSEWNYTPRGRVDTFKSSVGGLVAYTHSVTSSGERLTGQTNASGDTVLEHRDPLGRVVLQAFSDGTSLSYDYAGSQLQEERFHDSSGTQQAVRTHTYDTSNRLMLTWEWHDPASTSAGTAGSDHVIQYSHSHAGRLIQSGTYWEPTDVAYGLDGLPVEERWDDQVRDFFYDDLWTDSGGVVWNSTQITSTSVENLLSSSDIRTVDYSYDTAGRLLELETVSGPGSVSMAESVLHTWTDLDAFGNALDTEVVRSSSLLVSTGNSTAWTYDAMGRPLSRDTVTTSSASTFNEFTNWTWYDDGSMRSVLTPGGNFVEYGRGLSANLEYQLQDVKFNGTVWATVTSRDSELRIDQLMTSDNHVHGFTYDNMGRLDSRTLTGPNSASWIANYDDRGELMQEAVTDGTGASWLNSYTYTDEGWLESESRGGSGEFREYSHDSDGRRTQTKVNGVLSRVTAWSGSKVDSVDGVTVAYDDFDGVETDHLVYDYERDATGRVSAVYDGSTGHALYEATRDELGRIVALDESSSGERLTTWGLGIGGLPMEIEDHVGNTVNYLAVEGMLIGAMETIAGSAQNVALVTDGSGSVIQAAVAGVAPEIVEADTTFGEGAQKGSWDLRFVFAGLELLPDAPGIQMSQQRVYDEETGRFLSPDPIGQAGGLYRTRYAAGNSTRFVDPTGYTIETYGSFATEGTEEIYADAGASLYGNDVHAPRGIQENLDGGMMLDIDTTPGWIYDEAFYKLQAHRGFMNHFKSESAKAKALSSFAVATSILGPWDMVQEEAKDGWVRRITDWVVSSITDAARAVKTSVSAHVDRYIATLSPADGSGGWGDDGEYVIMSGKDWLASAVAALDGGRDALSNMLYGGNVEEMNSLKGAAVMIGRDVFGRVEDQYNTTKRIYGAGLGDMAEELWDASFYGMLANGDYSGAAMMPGVVIIGVGVGAFGLLDATIGGLMNVIPDVIALKSKNEALMSEGAEGAVDTTKAIVETAMLIQGINSLSKLKAPGKPPCKCLVGQTPVLMAAGLVAISNIAPGDVVLTVPDPSQQPEEPATPYAAIEKVLVFARSAFGQTSEHHFQGEDLVVLADGELRRAAGLRPGDEIFGLQGTLSIQSVQAYTETLTERAFVLEVTP